jgi:hypothetical protein
MTEMMTYRFNVYYEWQGPSDSNPMASPKTQDEIHRALTHFSGELSRKLPDPDASLTNTALNEDSKNMTLSVSTAASRSEVFEAMEATLKVWRLFAKPLPESAA